MINDEDGIQHFGFCIENIINNLSTAIDNIALIGNPQVDYSKLDFPSVSSVLKNLQENKRIFIPDNIKNKNNLNVWNDTIINQDEYRFIFLQLIVKYNNFYQNGGNIKDIQAFTAYVNPFIDICKKGLNITEEEIDFIRQNQHICNFDNFYTIDTYFGSCDKSYFKKKQLNPDTISNKILGIIDIINKDDIIDKNRFNKYFIPYLNLITSHDKFEQLDDDIKNQVIDTKKEIIRVNNLARIIRDINKRKNAAARGL